MQEAVQGQISCAKCKQQMQEGALQVHSKDHPLKDAPERVEWVETRRRTLGDRMLGRNKTRPLAMAVYRCPSCGWLELYAR